MQTFIDTGDFGMQAPIRRDTNYAQSAPTQNAPTQNGGFQRRTPANGNATRKPF